LLKDLLHGAPGVHADSPGLGLTDSSLPLAIGVPSVLAEAVVEVVCDIGARLSPRLVLQRLYVELVRWLPVHRADLLELLDRELPFLLPGPRYLPHRLVQPKRLVPPGNVLDLLLVDVDRHEILVVGIFVLVIFLSTPALGLDFGFTRTICGVGFLTRYFCCGSRSFPRGSVAVCCLGHFILATDFLFGIFSVEKCIVVASLFFGHDLLR